MNVFCHCLASSILKNFKVEAEVLASKTKTNKQKKKKNSAHCI